MSDNTIEVLPAEPINAEAPVTTETVQAGYSYAEFKATFRCVSKKKAGEKSVTLIVEGTPVDAPVAVSVGVGDKGKKYYAWLEAHYDEHLQYYINILNALKEQNLNVLHIQSKQKGKPFKAETLARFITAKAVSIIDVAEATASVKNTIAPTDFDFAGIKEAYARQQLRDTVGEGNYTEDDVQALMAKINFTHRAPGKGFPG